MKSAIRIRSKKNGEEILTYNPSMMKLNELYPIIFNGQQMALRKTKKAVEFLTFEPDTK